MGINLDRELAKMKVWLTQPKNRSRKLTANFALNWLNKIDPGGQVQGNGGHSQTCTRRVDIKGRLKPCGQPATQAIGQRPMCEKCFNDHRCEQANLQQKGIVNAN